MDILIIIDVHDERLAAAGSIPHGDFIQVACGIRRVSIIRILPIKIFDECIQTVDEALSVIKILIKIVFHKEQREVLKVLEHHGLGALIVDFAHMRNDVQIIASKRFFTDGAFAAKLRDELLIKARDTFTVDFFQRRLFHIHGEVAQFIHAELREQVAV